MRLRAHVLCVGWLMACGPDPCPEVGHASTGLSAPARHFVGLAAPYSYDAERRASEQRLRHSRADRRTLAWEVAAHLMEEVPAEGLEGVQMARFQSWYDRDDLRRMHRHLRAVADGRWDELSEAELDAAFVANREAVLAFASWPAERLAAYAESAQGGEHDLADISRVLFDPRASRHLLRSTERIAQCVREGAALATERPPDSVETEQHESLFFDGCGEQRLGPYEVAHGGRLVAEVSGDATLLVGDTPCAPCEVMGPATVTLTVRPNTRTRVQFDVRYDRPVDFWSPCLVDPFPDGSVVVKAEYRRMGFGVEVPVHDTSVAALRELTDAWDAEPPTTIPGDEDASLTVTLPRGERYRLVALHAMVKELDHWVWTTLWWSGDPDSDFGADRPEELRDTPLRQYKTCSVTAFEEQAVDTVSPELMESLAELERRSGGASWCSNPFIEQGAGNLSTNCIGCHQHAGNGLSSESILAGVEPIETFVESDLRARFLERVNFPTDYVFTASVMSELLLEP